MNPSPESSWLDPYRIVTAWPLPSDNVVVVFVEGQWVWIQPITEYERVTADAKKYAREIERPVKVLPMTISELMGFMGLSDADLAEGLSAEDEASDRQLVVSTCKDVLRNCNDGAVRHKAYALLANMGEMPA